MGDNNDIWTIGRILKWTEQYFGTKGVESPRLDAEVLLSHVLKKERIFLYVHFDQPLEAEELAAYKALIKQRVEHVPVAYLLGQKEFMGLDFKVTPATLIPRPDTEILVQAAVERLRGRENCSFADIGTGSGAICLSVLSFVPGSHAVTVDISSEARAVAEENAASLGLADRIEFFTGDLLEPVKDRKFTAILSNPPYIPEKDIEGLQAEVRCKEPYGALSGGEDGLNFYRRLCAEAPNLLEEDGFMAFEVGIGQAAVVAKLAEENPLIKRTEILKDLAGIERVVIAYI
ncbi:peptide chain release factor N(5)-glutamine methyltransferase [Selenomonas sp. KH1T6]|uniref:peptide chain release factor N(5)-glutamine methyltransferase n=1 Tax=Selenomonas sp. KH1T6 TaxID=3158784 RepID=UPI0008A7F393|nr:release factor glutamine methyltransferase [Selenomonas ruminantium]